MLFLLDLCLLVQLLLSLLVFFLRNCLHFYQFILFLFESLGSSLAICYDLGEGVHVLEGGVFGLKSVQSGGSFSGDLFSLFTVLDRMLDHGAIFLLLFGIVGLFILFFFFALRIIRRFLFLLFLLLLLLLHGLLFLFWLFLFLVMVRGRLSGAVALYHIPGLGLLGELVGLSYGHH